MAAASISADGHFNIPEGTITIVSRENFYGECSWEKWGVDKSAVKTVTIPDSAIAIGDHAFSGCTSLASITIPDSVTTIGNDAFNGCSSLTSITIPNSVTTIGNHAFYKCSSIASITIPDSVATIGNGAFNGCSSLASITIPDSVGTIGSFAFNGCSSLANITIPDSVTTIGMSTFERCSSLTSIAIPDSVTFIGLCAFLNCTSLTSITIPDSFTTIGNGAFNGCSSLASITIPDSVGTIGTNAFRGCNLLTTVIIRRTTPVANHDDGNASTDVWRTVFELPPPPQHNWQQQAPIPFEHVTRISAPDAVINQLTGPFVDFACLADVPRAMRVAPDAATWAAVELWLDWSPPTAAGYTDKTRAVCASRQRTLFVTMLGAARAARPPPVRSTRRANAMCVALEHRLPALPEELWVLIFGLLKHDTPPAF